ncbi:MAG: hypothetical protein CL896_04060 [Dehalococcoidia bacterium]|nr:hypothetical protein [Dehalococcoidia bacterium]
MTNSNARSTTVSQVVEVDECKHFWLIETPNGPVSRGICKICDQIRYFKNSIQISSWESDHNADYRPEANKE